MGTVNFREVTTELKLYTSQWLHTMGTVYFTAVFTEWELYTSQRLPHNGKSTLRSGYQTMKIVHFTMVNTQ